MIAGRRGVGLRGLAIGLEHLPAAAQRLVELHAVEQQLGAAVVGADAHGQARALRIEQRQQVDLAAVVERLRAAQRRFGGAAAAAAMSARWRSLPKRDQRVLDVLERAHDAVLVAQHRFGLAALGDLVDRLRAPGVEDRHRQQRGGIG